MDRKTNKIEIVDLTGGTEHSYVGYEYDVETNEVVRKWYGVKKGLKYQVDWGFDE